MGVGRGWAVKGVPPRARAAHRTGRPPASRVLRIAARRPAAALDPGAFTGPGPGVIGRGGLHDGGARWGCAQPEPAAGADQLRRGGRPEMTLLRLSMEARSFPFPAVTCRSVHLPSGHTRLYSWSEDCDFHPR